MEKKLTKADANIQAVQELNQILLEVSSSKSIKLTEFKFQISPPDDLACGIGNNFDDLNGLDENIEVNQLTELMPFANAKDYKFVKSTYQLTSKFVTMLINNLVILE